WIRRKRSRAPLAAMLYFVVTLSPAVGFVNVYPFKYSFVADHFQYLAGIGIIVLGSAALVRLAQRWIASTMAIQAILIVALGLPLAVLTRNHSRQFADAATLY